MGSEWESCTLGQLADITTGRLDSNQAMKNGVYPFFTCAPLPLQIDEFAFDCDAIILAGNNAEGIFHLNRFRGRFNAYQRTYVITAKAPTRVDIDFLFFALKTLTMRLGEYSQGTATKFLTKTLLTSLPLSLPAISQQRCIGEILKTLNDRIESLQQTNQVLEGITGTIFRSWFVDFEPVRAKAEGREPEGMDAATAALFTSSLTSQSELTAPQGWTIIRFSDTVTTLSGGTPKTSEVRFWDGGIPWFSMTDLPGPNQAFVIATKRKISAEGVESSSAKILPELTTVLTARGTVGEVAILGRAMAINQSCYGLQPKTFGPYSTYFQTLRLAERLRQNSHGSVFQTITRDTLASVRVVVPEARVVSAFELLVDPMMERVRHNSVLQATLTELRDTLLPRLISGKLRIPDAQRIVGEAL